ncbi:TorD/DmsD family molecular chaperone [Archaeoglobus neptunius]|uniref:TorD/DmsD family molecular chaperone n=1 Tax=Archaeoglobus neptunius TaxID=2798580 RepID=UPI0019297B6E|nr:molecular chaperone TorD family protein [Archaeoglobus neptunius]
MKEFKLFSILFSYPDDGKIKTALDLSRELGFREIEELLKSVSLRELEVEYTSIFVSAHPSIPCPPYQSFFEEGSVYGRSSVRMRELYRDFGLEYIYESEPADHISVELEFLSIHPNLVDEFREWFERFAECVKRRSKLYRPIATAFMNFLESLNQS